MRFLVDAHLPRRMTHWLNNAGHDAVHSLDLADGNRSTDEQIIEFAEREQRVVVTKDADFVNSHLLSARPAQLLLVSTGNISNRELEPLVAATLPIVVVEFQTHVFVELGRAGVTVRG
jgi:predicted nuclease of predicted toxin-antitoxin system